MRHKDIPLRERIIFALDVASPDRAMELVERLENRIGFYKVGLQLFLAGGFPVVERIAARGHKVMLDLKFYDVPQTVNLAVEQLAGRHVTYATVHGNPPILEAAARAKSDVKILAVTVLTSFGPEDAAQMFGPAARVEDVVLSRARAAIQAGIDGVVCSGLEAARLRAELGDDFFMVTPGIRPGGKTADDQKRVITAGRAISDGADHVVVGRPIRDAEDPISVVDAMQEEIRKALANG